MSFLRGLYSNVVLKQICLGSVSPDMGPSPWLLGTGPSRWGLGQSGCVGGRGQNVDIAVCGVPVQSQTESFSLHLAPLAGSTLTSKREKEKNEKERHLNCSRDRVKTSLIPRCQVLMWSE